MKIAVITDSTCDWAFGEYAKRDVTMVPLKICFGEQSYTDQYEITSEEFYDKMIASENLPTTSQPSPGDFAKVFEQLHEEGYDGAVCMHIAETLSGTVQSAEIAAEDAPLPVRVIDSHGATVSLGLLVDAACDLRDAGLDLDALAERLCAYRDEMRTLLALESLDNLVRGGRFPEEAAKQAGMLNIRMILSFDGEGRVIPFDKVKGAKAQINRCVNAAQDYIAEHGAARIRIVHTRNQKAVDAFVEALSEISGEFDLVSVDYCGATIATHVGMGALCVCIAPRVVC